MCGRFGRLSASKWTTRVVKRGMRLRVKAGSKCLPRCETLLSTMQAHTLPQCYNTTPNIRSRLQLEKLPRGIMIEFSEAFHSNSKVQGYTHDFYKYPARFSPNFVRSVLLSLTEPGDYVLDPFMGGGTTVVEAAAAGRHVVGSDLNELSSFVTRVKTTPLSEQDIGEIRRWVRDVKARTTGLISSIQPVEVPIRNMPVATYPFFATATKLADRLQYPRRRNFARCALVRVGQWALDARSTIPEGEILGDELVKRVERMISGLREFVAAAKVVGIYKNKITTSRKLMVSSAADPALVKEMERYGIRPRLVLTSPPYPGVHMLYHRWQVLGRRETPAPYWLANIQDGHGASHYTMGSRSELGLENYFAGLSAAFGNLRKIVASDATVVQLISFSDVVTQLPLYLDAMNKSGFEEANTGAFVSRQTRAVPNRKWYNQLRTWNDASREVLLVHRPSGRMP